MDDNNFTDLDQWDHLELIWNYAKKATEDAQCAMDFKIRNYLVGQGFIPKMAELLELEQLRACEAEGRGNMDNFIRARLSAT